MAQKSVPVMTPGEALAIRRELELTPAELSSILGVTERTVLDREAGRQPTNLQAALALEFVRAADQFPALRSRLEYLVTKSAIHGKESAMQD